MGGVSSTRVWTATCWCDDVKNEQNGASLLRTPSLALHTRDAPTSINVMTTHQRGVCGGGRLRHDGDDFPAKGLLEHVRPQRRLGVRVHVVALSRAALLDRVQHLLRALSCPWHQLCNRVRVLAVTQHLRGPGVTEQKFKNSNTTTHFQQRLGRCAARPRQR